MSVDPLAAKYPGWSPYHYSLNNPVNNIDLFGLAAVPSPNTGFDLWNHLSDFGYDYGPTGNNNRENEGGKRKDTGDKNNKEQKENKTLNNWGEGLAAAGTTFDVQMGVLKLAEDLEKSGTAYLTAMEFIGRFINLSQATISSYQFIQKPSLGGFTKTTIDWGLVVWKVNPWILVGKGVLDATRLSDPFYKAIDEAPSVLDFSKLPPLMQKIGAGKYWLTH